MTESSTGNYRLRQGLFGKLIQQVQIKKSFGGAKPDLIFWRDAKVTDMDFMKWFKINDQ